MSKSTFLKSIFVLALAVSWVWVSSDLAYGQEHGSDETADFEELFRTEEENQLSSRSQRVELPADEVKGLSDLGKLSPFEDVAVIQKRFLPKTGRFELFGGALLTLNDVYFLSGGLTGRFAYNFSERYGVELVAIYLQTTEREVVDDLKDLGVQTQSFVTPETFIGLDFKWSPVYGKMTYRDRKITPFDLYFSIGAGMTGTNMGSSEPTLHLGTGQTFALSKSMAFRWDFSWNVFSAATDSKAGGDSSMYNNLYLTVGMSLFFPEATYR